MMEASWEIRLDAIFEVAAVVEAVGVVPSFEKCFLRLLCRSEEMRVQVKAASHYITLRLDGS